MLLEVLTSVAYIASRKGICNVLVPITREMMTAVHIGPGFTSTVSIGVVLMVDAAQL